MALSEKKWYRGKGDSRTWFLDGEPFGLSLQVSRVFKEEYYGYRIYGYGKFMCGPPGVKYTLEEAQKACLQRLAHYYQMNLDSYNRAIRELEAFLG